MKTLAVIFSIGLLARPPAALAEDPELPPITPGPAITLAEALKLADERNLGLAAARTDIARARADLKYSWALLLPTASGSLGLTHNDHEDTANIGGMEMVTRKQDDLRGNLQVNLPLVNARAWLGVGVADIGEEASALAVENVRQTLLLTVAQSFFAALSAGSLIDVHEAQIRASQRHLAIATVRHRSGTGARIDVVRARTELLKAREDLLVAHTALDNSRDALAVLTGVQGLPRPTPVETLPHPPGKEHELSDLAARQREDLKLKRTLLMLADRQLTLSWMSFIPTLNATWQLNQQITDPSSFTDPDQTRWFIGLTLDVPIYDHTRYAELDQQRAALHKAQLEAEDAELQARLEVRQALRSWRKALDLVSTAGERARLAAETVKLAEAAYENGTGNSLDVTDARRTSRQAEIDLTFKRFDAQLSLLELLRKVGLDMSTLARKEAS